MTHDAINQKARKAWSDALRKHMQPGAVLRVEFQHDPDCMIYTSARICTCSPDRVLIDSKGKTLATVPDAGPYDPLELTGVLP